MEINKLFKLGKPAFYITPVSADQFCNLYLHLTSHMPGAAIRMIRGKKSQTNGDFFNEIGAGLGHRFAHPASYRNLRLLHKAILRRLKDIIQPAQDRFV